jgi:hydrogenase maturation protein HypF
MITNNKRIIIRIQGIVQGVGFRPFIYNLAKEYSISGWVNNDSGGVLIDAEGKIQNLNKFREAITKKAPPLSFIESIDIKRADLIGYTDFIIEKSIEIDSHDVFISSDVSVCKDCLRDISEPTNSRYNYPFTNCTNCGPRFTITINIPYDRKNTVMKDFIMCEDCRKEYENPLDRRFHAQPISCYNCGPRLKLVDNKGNNFFKNEEKDLSHFKINSKILMTTKALLKENKIIAIKGVGGYHLACNTKNRDSVKLLRKRKNRDGKPFALMAKDIDVIRKYCIVTNAEEVLLNSIKKPVVLLSKKENCPLPIELSSDNEMLGIMLPYTPLHYLLFNEDIELLVMTSGNISGEPIFFKDKEALEGLSGIADYFLINDREIYIRTDDSITSAFNEKEYIIRRSRGYVPFPIKLPIPSNVDSNKLPTILSTGPELKNTFCFTKHKYAFLSHHIGDLENLETLDSFEDGIEHFKRILKTEPEAIAYDMHPEYISTKYAKNLELTKIEVQHHHAHIASCMAENYILDKVIGIAFDGTGYGLDGAIWGGEVFSGDYLEFKREAHFSYVPMPGGEISIKEPWRMALSYLNEALTETNQCYEDKQGSSFGGYKINFLEEMDWLKGDMVLMQIQKKINSPMTSSAGRLFDAVSALLGLCTKIKYEGQGAILLEKASQKQIFNEKYNEFYEVNIYSESPLINCDDENNNHHNSDACKIIDTISLFRSIFYDLEKGLDVSKISAKFHNSLVVLILNICKNLRKSRNLNKVVLSGGVFQNKTLLSLAVELLKKNDFEVYTHSSIPTNDGGIAYGQAVIALWKLLAKTKCPYSDEDDNPTE